MIKFNLKNKDSRLNLKGKLVSRELNNRDEKQMQHPQTRNNTEMFDGTKRMIIFHQNESSKGSSHISQPISLKTNK